jgi:hypothetical protein
MRPHKILIAGDSFAADYTVKYPDQHGWPNLLSKDYDVTNIAQAGVTEYKVLQQINSVNLKKYDSIIISHASPNRVHCEQHPIHHNDPLHKNSDLLYTDVMNHPENPDCIIAAKYFERFVDLKYYSEISKLFCMEIANILGNYPHLNQLHLVNYYNNNPYDFLESFNFNSIWFNNQGIMNHFNQKGNILLLDEIIKWIKTLET